MRRSILCFVLWTAAATVCSAGGDSLVLTHIANMGVMVTCGDTKILIDALFDDPNPDYRAPSREVMEKIMKSQAPFEGVVLALVTHNHTDHFAAGVAVRFLEASTGAVLVAPPDAIAEMQRAAGSGWAKIAPRAIPLNIKLNGKETRSLAGVSVTAFRTLHSGRREPPINFMYLIDVGGRRIFHEGDSTGDEAAYARSGLDSAPADLAIVHWFTSEPSWWSGFLIRTLRARHIAMGHIAAVDEAEVRGQTIPRKYKNAFYLLPGMPPRTIQAAISNP